MRVLADGQMNPQLIVALRQSSELMRNSNLRGEQMRETPMNS